MRLLSVFFVLFVLLPPAKADPIFSGSAAISVASSAPGTETTDWSFTLALANGSDPTFTVQHVFTGVEVFPWGGWQIDGSDAVSVSGDFPSPFKGWLPELEGFSNTPIPSPMTWDVNLFRGSGIDSCTFCADWTPVQTPEPSTWSLVALGGLTSVFVILRRRNFRRDYLSADNFTTRS